MNTIEYRERDPHGRNLTHLEAGRALAAGTPVAVVVAGAAGAPVSAATALIQPCPDGPATVSWPGAAGMEPRLAGRFGVALAMACDLAREVAGHAAARGAGRGAGS